MPYTEEEVILVSCVGRPQLRNNITVIFQDAWQNHVEAVFVISIVQSQD